MAREENVIAYDNMLKEIEQSTYYISPIRYQNMYMEHEEQNRSLPVADSSCDQPPIPLGFKITRVL